MVSWHTEVHNTNGILIGSAIFAGLTTVTDLISLPLLGDVKFWQDALLIKTTEYTYRPLSPMNKSHLLIAKFPSTSIIYNFYSNTICTKMTCKNQKKKPSVLSQHNYFIAFLVSSHLTANASVLSQCWLAMRKSIWPVKIGMVICLEQGAYDLYMVQLMPLPPHHLLLYSNPGVCHI